MIRVPELIERKRDGGELSPAELSELMLGYAKGEIPDYQLAAFCMAVFFRGLSSAETYAMTDALIRTGETVDLHGALGRKVVDKHSTGGVGDKTSIAVGPIVAACGVPFGKMSGRGLGHTGGTLDKLESIPGFKVELTTEELIDQVRAVGLAIVGATADLVPADKKLYALRDVTATVDNYSLIAASIMSKKIAGGADAIVLDVKVGDGAFMKARPDAERLAEVMIDLGNRASREVVAVISDMDEPLGHAVGNALEIREAIATLRGEGPPDFVQLVVEASTQLLTLSDLGVTGDEARSRVEQAIADGSALAAYERWIAAQGGNPDEAALPSAPIVHEVTAPQAGYIQAVGAVQVGNAALRLGAGRRDKDDLIDHSVGVVLHKTHGDKVAPGEALAEIHARDESSAEAAAGEVLAAYEFADEAPPERNVILGVITA
ncbi:MAG: thymidine phosphorylase [Actinomycetota bacterium]|nr:thymidine phosphorylase [Actinomycetota bacterium]